MRSPRPAGVAVLAVAVVVLALGAGVTGRTVRGQAAPAPVPAAPAVGDCLLATTAEAASRVDDQGLRSADRQFGPCAAADRGAAGRAAVIVGEVAAVLTEQAGRPHDACAAPVGEFVGFDALPSWSEGDLWRPSGGATVLIGHPDVRQWAAGQRWQACVLLPPLFTADGALDPLLAASADLGTARGAWSDPGYRNRLGDCFTDVVGPLARLTAPVFCGAVHDGERLAVASWQRDPPSLPLLRQTCLELGARQLDTADPTRGGALVADVVVVGPDEQPIPVAGDRAPPDARADCLVRPAEAGQRLTATLLGRGDAPLPLTPG